MNIYNPTLDQRENLLEKLFYSEKAFSDSTMMLYSAMAERLGINPSDWRVLGLLEEHGPVTAGALSTLAGLPPATVTDTINRLVRDGWVHRKRDAEDGRRVLIALDPDAFSESISACFLDFKAEMHRFFAKYTDAELALLLRFTDEVTLCQREMTEQINAGKQLHELIKCQSS